MSYVHSKPCGAGKLPQSLSSHPPARLSNEVYGLSDRRYDLEYQNQAVAQGSAAAQQRREWLRRQARSIEFQQASVNCCGLTDSKPRDFASTNAFSCHVTMKPLESRLVAPLSASSVTRPLGAISRDFDRQPRSMMDYKVQRGAAEVQFLGELLHAQLPREGLDADRTKVWQEQQAEVLDRKLAALKEEFGQRSGHPPAAEPASSGVACGSQSIPQGIAPLLLGAETTGGRSSRRKSPQSPQESTIGYQISDIVEGVKLPATKAPAAVQDMKVEAGGAHAAGQDVKLEAMKEFEKHDTNGNGYLNKLEFAKLKEESGLLFNFEDLDVNEDGMVTAKEYVAAKVAMEAAKANPFTPVDARLAPSLSQPALVSSSMGSSNPMSLVNPLLVGVQNEQQDARRLHGSRHLYPLPPDKEEQLPRLAGQKDVLYTEAAKTAVDRRMDGVAPAAARTYADAADLAERAAVPEAPSILFRAFGPKSEDAVRLLREPRAKTAEETLQFVADIIAREPHRIRELTKKAIKVQRWFQARRNRAAWRRSDSEPPIDTADIVAAETAAVAQARRHDDIIELSATRIVADVEASHLAAHRLGRGGRGASLAKRQGRGQFATSVPASGNNSEPTGRSVTPRSKECQAFEAGAKVSSLEATMESFGVGDAIVHTGVVTSHNLASPRSASESVREVQFKRIRGPSGPSSFDSDDGVWVLSSADPRHPPAWATGSAKIVGMRHVIASYKAFGVPQVAVDEANRLIDLLEVGSEGGRCIRCDGRAKHSRAILSALKGVLSAIMSYDRPYGIPGAPEARKSAAAVLSEVTSAVAGAAPITPELAMLSSHLRSAVAGLY